MRTKLYRNAHCFNCIIKVQDYLHWEEKLNVNYSQYLLFQVVLRCLNVCEIATSEVL